MVEVYQANQGTTSRIQILRKGFYQIAGIDFIRQHGCVILVGTRKFPAYTLQILIAVTEGPVAYMVYIVRHHITP